MILFYDKKTGEIVGTIGGRVHTPEEMKMWIGDPQETDRVVVEWKQTGKEKIRTLDSEEFVDTGVVDQDGYSIYKKKKIRREIPVKEFVPDHEQSNIFLEVEKDYGKIYNYKVKNGKLIKK